MTHATHEEAAPGATSDRILGGWVTRTRRPRVGDRWLVLVHGLGESGLCFRSLVTDPRLLDFGILIPDLPGYGRTPWLPDPLSLAEIAEALHQWIPDALSEAGAGATPSYTLLGHSMGGVIGQMFCEFTAARKAAGSSASTARLEGFFNVEGNLSFGDCSTSRMAAPFSRGDYLTHGHATVCEHIRQMAETDRAQRGYHASAQFCDPRSFHAHSIELVALSRGEDLARRFSVLAVAKAYLLGAPGGAAQRSQQLLAQVGESPLRVEPAGHWPFLDQPEKFIAHLAEFLAIAD
jgi:pimeloyl-ACP methyl ester carboxylesterase